MTFVQAGQNTGTSTVPTVTLGAAPMQGSLLIAAVFVPASTAPTAGTGWTRVAGFAAGGSGGSTRSLAFFTKVAGASESTSQAITNTQSTWAAVLIEHKDIDTAAAVSSSCAITNSGTSHATPSVTPTASIPAVVIGAYAVRGSAQAWSNQQVNGSATGVTERADTGLTNAWLSMADLEVASTSGAYAGTATCTSAFVGCAGMLVIRAVPAGPGPKNMTGSAAGVATVSGAIVRTRALTGTSTGRATVTGTISKAAAYRNLTGSAAGQATVSGTVSRRRPLTGTSTGTSTVSGTLGKRVTTPFVPRTAVLGTPLSLPGRLLLGSPAPQTAVAPPLPAGSSAGRATVTGTLTARRALSGTSVGVAVASAALTRRRALTAASAGKATVAGVLNARRALTGLAAGRATVVGSIARRVSLTGTSAGVATVTGFIDKAGSVYRNLFGTSAGKATVSAVITRRRALTALSAGRATVTGVIGRVRQLTGLSAGKATVTGLITRRRALVGLSQGRATVTGSLTRRRALTGTSAGVASVSGTISKAPDKPLTSVIWVGDHFEMSQTGLQVLWDGQKFEVTGDFVDVLWEDEVFTPRA